MSSHSSWALPRFRSWTWPTGYAGRAGRGSADAGAGLPSTLGDAIVAVCFLAIVALVVFGSLFMLFVRVTENLPPAAPATCQRLESCLAAPVEGALSWDEPARVDEPAITP